MICFLQISAWVRVWREYMYNRYVLKFYKMCFKKSFLWFKDVCSVMFSLWNNFCFHLQEMRLQRKGNNERRERDVWTGREVEGVEGGTVRWGREPAWIEDQVSWWVAAPNGQRSGGHKAPTPLWTTVKDLVSQPDRKLCWHSEERSGKRAESVEISWNVEGFDLYKI